MTVPHFRESIPLEIRVRATQDGRPVNLASLERTIANALPGGMELTDCSIRRVPPDVEEADSPSHSTNSPFGI